MIYRILDQQSVASQFMAELRDEEIQKDTMRFRKNMIRLGKILAYELSKKLEYSTKTINTPLGTSECSYTSEKIVLATILRAGLPLHQGMLEVFDGAENAFIAAYRQHHKDGTFEIKKEYITCPTLNDKTLVLCDPMLATGSSFDVAMQSLLSYGKPQKVFFVTVISSRPGLEHLSRLYPDIDILTIDIDEELTAKSYIVPGLGDAGDLAYGSKLQE